MAKNGLELESIDSQTASMADEKLNEGLTTHYPSQDPITEEEDNVVDDMKMHHNAYDSASQASISDNNKGRIIPKRKASKEQQNAVLQSLLKMKIKTDVNHNLVTVKDSPLPQTNNNNNNNNNGNNNNNSNNNNNDSETAMKIKQCQGAITKIKDKIAKLQESLVKNDYLISNLNLDSLDLEYKKNSNNNNNDNSKNSNSNKNNNDDEIQPSSRIRGTSQDVEDMISRRLSLQSSQNSSENLKAIRKMKDRDKVNTLDWCYDNNRMVTASNAGAIIVWDVEHGHKLLGIPLKASWTQAVTFSPDGKFIACGGLDNLCSIFSITDTIGWHQGGLPDNTLQHHEGYISCIRYITERKLLTASGDGTIALWDIDTHKVSSKFIDHMHDVQSVSVCHTNPNLFVSGAIDAKAKFWDMRLPALNACVFTFEGHTSDINQVSWFPDGNSFITASEDSTLKLFDIKCLKELNCYFDEKDLNPAKDVSFSKSGQFIFASYDEAPYCVMWDTITSHKIRSLDINTRSCLQVSPKGNYLATGSWDMFIRIWTLPKN